MINWYKKVVFENYANFNGRARRSEFWYYILFNYIILIIAAVLDNILGFKLASAPYGYLYLVVVFATLIPSLAVGVRRIHDVGKSGWFILVPIYNIVLYCTDGNQGENEYGSDPKAADE